MVGTTLFMHPCKRDIKKMCDLAYYELSLSCKSHVCCLCLLSKVSEKQGNTAFTLWSETDRQLISYLRLNRLICHAFV